MENRLNEGINCVRSFKSKSSTIKEVHKLWALSTQAFRSCKVFFRKLLHCFLLDRSKIACGVFAQQEAPEVKTGFYNYFQVKVFIAHPGMLVFLQPLSTIPPSSIPPSSPGSGSGE